MSNICIAIVDDQTLVREGLASLLAMVPDLTVVGTAADGREALALVDELEPDVVLMDVRMPGMNGVAATREIRARDPHTRVIVLTTFDHDEYVFESLRAGASGYLLKDADPDHLAEAIRAVHAGDSILDPAVTQKVIRRATGTDEAEPALAERLTPREHDVLGLMAEGAANAEIAEQLCLAEGTVKNHVSHILGKLGARGRAHAVRLAVEWGLLDE
ncbi:MAG: Transcriptional regulatory protein DegU [Anaerolineales bacterium]|nr:Transcriptional regulatory protein DegU [Anaerolineales bacterium]